MPGGFTVPTEFIAIDKFSSKLWTMSTATQEFVSRATAGVARVERGFYKLLTPLNTINRMLSGLGYYIGLATLVLFLGRAVNVLADFQQANIDLALVMDTTVAKNAKFTSQARSLALQTGIAATEISKLQYELATLFGSDYKIESLVAPITRGAIALRTTPEELGGIVGAILQAYKMGPEQAQTIVDQLTKAGNETALTFEKMKTMLPTTLTAANLTKMDFPTLLAHLGILADAQVHVATAGTAVKNMMIISDVKGKQLDKTLTNLAGKNHILAQSYHLFKQRSAVSAAVLSTEMERLAGLTEKIRNESGGVAEKITTGRLDSIRGGLTILKRSWEEFIFSIDDGNGPLALSIKNFALIASAVFLLASGSDEADDKLRQLKPEILQSARNWMFWTKWVLRATAALVVLALLFKVWALISVVLSGALAGLNFMLGLTAGFFQLHYVWIGRSIPALWGYIAATNVATAASAAWAAVLALNPIALIIEGVIALIILVTMMVRKWDQWGAAASVALLLIMGPFALILPMIMEITRNWDLLVKAFSSDGMIAGIKLMGKVILSAIIYPFEQLIEIIGNFTGMDLFKNVAAQMHEFRHNLGVTVGETPTQKKEEVNPEVERGQKMQKDFWAAAMAQKSSVEIWDKTGGNFDVLSPSEGVNIKSDSTMNYLNGYFK